MPLRIGGFPVDPGRDPHITGCDVFWDDLEGGGHQHHKLRIVSFERKQRSDSAAALLDPGEPDVKCRVHQR